MSEVVLKVKGVGFAYGGRAALAGVDMEVSAGEVVGLIGPNGAGKSTLIKVLTGYLKSEGEVEWFGRRNWGRRELARKVAYLAQSPEADAGDTVGDVLRLGRAAHWGAFGIEGERDEEVVRGVAERLGLGESMGVSVDALSGGQRQRVFVGRCLAQEPGVMLLDEPGTYLDLRHQIELLELLRGLAREKGVAVVMASHDLNLAGAYADRLVLLDGGRVVVQGKPGEVLTTGVLGKVYGVEMRQAGRWVVPVVGS